MVVDSRTLVVEDGVLTSYLQIQLPNLTEPLSCLVRQGLDHFIRNAHLLILFTKRAIFESALLTLHKIL